MKLLKMKIIEKNLLVEQFKAIRKNYNNFYFFDLFDYANDEYNKFFSLINVIVIGIAKGINGQVKLFQIIYLKAFFNIIDI